MTALTKLARMLERSIGIADLRQQLSDQADRLAKLEIERGNTINLLEIERGNTADLLEIERGNTANLLEIERNNIANLLNVLGQLSKENQSLAARLAYRHSEAMTALLNMRELLFERLPQSHGSCSRPVMTAGIPLQAAWKELARRAPAVFPIWREALAVGTQSYNGFPVGSCSVSGHREADLFRKFLQPYRFGNLLDIGCGPQPVPYYLRDCVMDHVFGIDPISTPSDHPFTFVSGVAEFLPWLDGQFDTVVSATTLDHFFLLDIGLLEVHRVLRPGGHFVAWIAIFEGAPRYDPYVANFVPADSEHLFHLDPAWFEPMMSERFHIRERVTFELPFPYAFYAFEKK